MVTNIVNLLSKAFMANNIQSSNAVTTVSSNPFASPLNMSSNRNRYSPYAKNEPVQGGYFAGYHNGVANIVGQRLWVMA